MAPSIGPPAPVAVIVAQVGCAVGTGTSVAIWWAPYGSDVAESLGGQGMPQMNPPPVSPRLCRRTSGASIALRGGRDPGDESARPLCSRHFQRTDTTAPVSGRSEVDTQAPGRGRAVSPPRAVRCRNREAEKVPPADKAAGWGGSRERVRYGPDDRVRREHAPCKPPTGGPPVCEHRVGRATTGATRQAPPPAEGQVRRLVPAPCSQRAYARGQTARMPPPPNPFSPPTQEMGEDSLGDSEGTWGGAEDRPKRRGGDGRRAVETPSSPSPKEKKPKKKRKQSKTTRQSRDI